MKSPTDNHTPDDERAARAMIEHANRGKGLSTVAIDDGAQKMLRSIAHVSKPGAMVKVLRQQRRELVAKKLEELYRASGFTTRKDTLRTRALELCANENPDLWFDLLPPPAVKRSAARTADTEEQPAPLVRAPVGPENRASRASQIYAASIGASANATQDASGAVMDAIGIAHRTNAGRMTEQALRDAIRARTKLAAPAVESIAGAVFRADPRKRIAVLASALTKNGVQ